MLLPLQFLGREVVKLRQQVERLQSTQRCCSLSFSQCILHCLNNDKFSREKNPWKTTEPNIIIIIIIISALQAYAWRGSFSINCTWLAATGTAAWHRIFSCSSTEGKCMRMPALQVGARSSSWIHILKLLPSPKCKAIPRLSICVVVPHKTLLLILIPTFCIRIWPLVGTLALQLHHPQCTR